MSNVQLMTVGHRVEHFGAEISGIALGITPLLSDAIKEIATCH
jgi:hypothetical protein